MPLLAWIFAGLIALTPAHTATYVAALPGLQGVFTGTPQGIGLTEGGLSPCPDSPNCVVSQEADPSHAIAPIPYQGSRQQAYATLKDVLSVVPRTKIVAETDNYIHAESSSRLMGFVDDVEFYFPADTPVIHMRSAARLGESDLGVNRRRLEQIRLAAQDLGL